MSGQDVPWIDTTGGAGSLSPAYRGRLFDAMQEIYLQYRYVAKVDVAAQAPAVAQAWEQRDGPLHWRGTVQENFNNGSYYQGQEYWLAFPPQLAKQDLTVPGPGESNRVTAADRAHLLGKGARTRKDSGGSYLELNARSGRAGAAIRNIFWYNTKASSLVGLLVRSDGPVNLRAAATMDGKPYASVPVPDTKGAWRYVWWDIGTNELAQSAVGENILFLDATGTGTLDVRTLVPSANGVITPPTFQTGRSLSLTYVAGEQLTFETGLEDDGSVSATLEGSPAGSRSPPTASSPGRPRSRPRANTPSGWSPTTAPRSPPFRSP